MGISSSTGKEDCPKTIPGEYINSKLKNKYIINDLHNLDRVFILFSFAEIDWLKK